MEEPGRDPNRPGSDLGPSDVRRRTGCIRRQQIRLTDADVVEHHRMAAALHPQLVRVHLQAEDHRR